MSISETLKDITPPFLYRFLNRIKHPLSFYGNYSLWQDALSSCSGYDAPQILEKVKSALLKVKNGEVAYERDSVVFPKIQYSWPVLSALLCCATEHESHLTVLDFGGSLGSGYFQNRQFLQYVKVIWGIVEQPHFVECGSKHFQSNELKFYYSIDDCISDIKPKLFLASSVLQYIKEPYELIHQITEKDFEYLVFDRMHFFMEGDERIFIQKNPPQVYKGDYPVWILNYNKFVNAVVGYKLIADFDHGYAEPLRINHRLAYWKGFIFKKRCNVAVDLSKE